MWRSEPGQTNLVFGDSIVVGVPAATTERARHSLERALHDAFAKLAHPRYLGKPTIVPTNTPHRIILCRRSHGGRPHYLKSWADIKRADENWIKDGGLSTRTFSLETFAKFHPLEPAAATSSADEAFALALAYGWIARRGGFYYFNLTVEGGSNKRVVRLASDWDGPAFVSNKLQCGPALELLITSGRMTYNQRSDVEATRLLANGLEKARDAFRSDRGKIDAILAAFADLRIAAGDQAVLQELTRYVDDLLKRVKSGGGFL